MTGAQCANRPSESNCPSTSVWSIQKGSTMRVDPAQPKRERPDCVNCKCEPKLGLTRVATSPRNYRCSVRISALPSDDVSEKGSAWQDCGSTLPDHHMAGIEPTSPSGPTNQRTTLCRHGPNPGGINTMQSLSTHISLPQSLEPYTSNTHSKLPSPNHRSYSSNYSAKMSTSQHMLSKT